ncbi:MAG: ABC transporter permease [Acidobacteria bacterium]|jgi:ABC-2 type transport system permease protein|nr:ABC transporter permease [Acidobacteriota bacterium]
MIKRIKGIWEFKYLIYNLVLRDLKVKYKGTTLGFLWSLLNPLLMLAVYTIVFKYLIGPRVENFTIFLFSALLPWTFLSSAIAMGSGSITDNGNLVKKVYFPREVLPFSVVLVNLFHFFLTFLVLIPALLFFHIQPGFAFLFLVVIIFFQTLFVLGLTLIFAALNVYYRDIKHLLEVLLQLWFWMTPIIWPITLFPGKYHPLVYLNPFTVFVTAYRNVILENRVPDILVITAFIVLGILVFFLGAFVFQKKQRRFAEEI